MPNRIVHGTLIALSSLVLTIWALPLSARESHGVAGLAPHARPEGAPVITVFDRSPDWRSQALRGIAVPHPKNLDFLDSQGAWYTPFSRPGMHGHYDLRGWHKVHERARQEAGQ